MVKVHKHERGAALLLVILSLVLVTAIAIAMLFSADTETAIAANYRDKQVAMYASQAGLQEARSRINPWHDTEPYYIHPPTGLASASAANVVYILNPGSSSETINPWDPNSPYYDTNICTAVPSGLCSGSPAHPPTSGYTVFNNYSDTSSPFHIVTGSTYTPLKYKWVRIILKADNSTPVHVSGSNAGTEVCWDETHGSQMLLPAGYNTDCTKPGGYVSSVSLKLGNDGGSGYTAPPTVSFSGGGGSGASATAVLTSVPTHQVASVTLTNGGSNYHQAPNVVIDPPPLGGTQATAMATMIPPGAPLTSVSLTNAGGCYQTNTSNPIVTISGGGGAGATATSTLTGKTCVYSWSASGSCKTKAGTSVNVTGNGGFAGTITFRSGNGNVSATSVTNPGSGISSPPLTTLAGCSITPSFTYGYQVASLALGNAGSGYSSAPTVNIAKPGVGATPTGTATIGAVASGTGIVTGITVTNPGSGYGATPAVTITPKDGYGSGATASVVMGTSGKVSGFANLFGGSGYTSAPLVTLTPAAGDITGSGAQAVAAINPGDYYGNVYLLTSFARAAGGSIAFTEMEVANMWLISSAQPQKIPGAMTLAGPNPAFVPPNSTNMVINGHDANSCGEGNQGPKPAIGVYDDPNNPPKPPALTAVQTVTNSVSSNGAKPGNYTGINSTADVHNVYDQVGDPASAASGLDNEVQAIIALLNEMGLPQNDIQGNSNGTCSNTVVSVNGCIPLGRPPKDPSAPTSSPDHWPTDAIVVVEGNAVVGPVSGYGILVVTGDLIMDGNFSWSGVILVIGNGNVTWQGGGNGQITGAIYIANTHGASGTLSMPDATWSGGGGNGVQYDHCRADNLLANLPRVVKPSKEPLRVLSMRSLGNQ